MKLQILSYNPCNDPLPMPGAEIEQRLTISENGRVWFRVRNVRQHVEGKGCAFRRQAHIGRWKAEHILNCFSGYLVEEFSETGEHVGDWHAVMNDDQGHRVHARGLLHGGITYQGADLSRLIRRLIPIGDLWVFDANVSGDYDGMQQISRFARGWIQRYERCDESICDGSTAFGSDCLACGFRMDEGKEFLRRYPGIAESERDLEACFHQISDVDVLGSGIYSCWEHIRSIRPEDLLIPENREWFLLALRRLEQLAAK